MMYEMQQHEMQLKTSHPSGIEEWHCPTCGRRILLRLPPTDEMIIIEPGDPYASHSGSTWGLRIGTTEVTVFESTAPLDWRVSEQ